MAAEKLTKDDVLAHPLRYVDFLYQRYLAYEENQYIYHYGVIRSQEGREWLAANSQTMNRQQFARNLLDASADPLTLRPALEVLLDPYW